MTSARSREAWVTFAENDESSSNVLTLARSLREFRSNRKLMVILGPHVSKSTRLQLAETCDVVKGDFSEHEDGAEATTDTIDYFTLAKIHTWSLTYLNKAVFLNPNTLFLKNCDELFELGGTHFGDSNNPLNTSTIVLQPSRKTYELLSEIVSQPHEDDHGAERVQAQQKYALFLIQKFGVKRLDWKYNYAIDFYKASQKSHDSWNLIRPGIVHFTGKQVGLGVTNGILVDYLQRVLEFRNEMFKEISLPENFPHLSLSMDQNEEIAIIGMSCRLPGANNLDEFWSLLMNQEDAVGPLPLPRHSHHANFPQSKWVQAGFLKCPIDMFDAQFFGMSPKEAELTDPQHRLLLEVGWEALEDAGINPDSLHSTQTGVYTGLWRQDYKDILYDQHLPKSESFRGYIGNGYSASAGRLSHFLGLSGPSMSNESGCSASMVAIGQAVQDLRRGVATLGIAGGCNLLTKGFILEEFPGMASPDGHSKPFEAEADGFGRAEGCGVLVLKTLSNALRDGDRIYALIRGYGMSQEGMSSSMGTPTAACEALAIEMALQDAKAHPMDISFVEVHGTGTSIGDPIEISAIKQMYGRQDENGCRQSPLILGGVKANIGHTESCSGVTGVIKTALSLYKETIPPHYKLNKLNPAISSDFEKIPATLPLTPVPWLRTKFKNQPRLAGVSSFGITGTDAHVIMEEAPLIPTLKSNSHAKSDVETEMSTNILTLSAKTVNALTHLITSYEIALTNNTEIPLNLVDVCYTANTGRAHMRHRTAILGKDLKEIVNKLQSGAFEIGEVQNGPPPKLCFLFTGQGSQRHLMGKHLYEHSPIFKFHFDFCAEALHTLYGINIKEALFGDSDPTLIHDSLYSQTSIFVMEYCLCKLYESWGIFPDYVMGHSLGEFAAATVAGIMSVEDALKLVGARSTLISSLKAGKMIAIRANVSKTEELIQNFHENFPKSLWLDIAGENTNEQTTIAGTQESINEFSKFCSNHPHNIKTTVLDATHAFHSRAMDPMLREYRELAETIQYYETKVKYISGVKGCLLSSDTLLDGDYWVQHTRERVKFLDSSKAIYEEGCRHFVEVGPHPVLSAILVRNMQDTQVPADVAVTCLPSMRKDANGKSCDEWMTLLQSLSKLYLLGVNVNWTSFHSYENSNQKVRLPFYPFQRKKYWLQTHVDTGGSNMHPLLGRPLHNPTGQTIFQSYVNPTELTYILDHCVGDHVIFPASGYLEMSLVAGYNAMFGIEDTGAGFEPPTGSDSTPILIQDLIIRSPLEMDKGESQGSGSGTHIQTTICKSNSEDGGTDNLKIDIFSSKTNGGKWVQHSQAKFHCALDQSTYNLGKTSIDIQRLKGDMGESVGKDVYANLAQLGYNFGPQFQTIPNYSINEEGDVLAELDLPENSEHGNHYFIHPVIGDAMIQVGLISKRGKTPKDDKPGLWLPVAIKEVVRFTGIPKDTTKVYLHGINSNGEVRLYDSDGRIILLMSGLEFLQTTLPAFEKVLNDASGEQLNLPIFTEEWVPSSGNPSVNSKTMFMNSVEEIWPEIQLQATQNENIEEDENNLMSLNKGIAHIILLAFLDLGWNVEIAVGSKVTLRSLMKELGVKEEYSQVFHRFLNIIAGHGYLTQESEEKEDEFTIQNQIPTKVQIENIIEECFQGRDGRFEREWEAAFVFKGKLSGLLTGSRSVLEVLFPADNNANRTGFNAETFNAEISGIRRAHILLENALDHALSKLDGQTPLNIIEVGAGTGSTTALVLQLLEQKYPGVKFTYYFTDISTHLLNEAKTKPQFKSCKSLQFKTLNIELDPKTQGFPPNQADLVIGSNVLHATKDLCQTVRNVRHLLKDSSLFVFVETFKPFPLVDLVYGLTEGYSRFSDHHLRPHHCVINGSQWEDLMSGYSAGFSTVRTESVMCGHFGIVMGETTAHSISHVYIPPTLETEQKFWLIFDPNSSFSIELTRRMELSGVNILKVKASSSFTSKDDEIRIRPDSKQDMDDLFQTVLQSREKLQGIIYAWSLSTITTDLLTQSFLHCLQSLIRHSQTPPPLYLLTEGCVFPPGIDQEARPPIASVLLGMARSFRTENPFIPLWSIDLSPNDEDESASGSVDQVFRELWKDNSEKDAEHLVSYRGGKRLVGRLTASIGKSVSNLTPNPPLALPKTDRLCLTLPTSKNMMDLKVGVLHRTELSENEIEVKVQASALNFRDIFSVLKPTEFGDGIQDLNSVGNDFSGIVSHLGSGVTKWKVGDCVIGAHSMNQAMVSHVTIHQDLAVGLPTDMTFEEGSTLPTVFATAYWCLVSVANLRPGEWILIHTATGGVGLCALQIARSIGANIIATAGSRRKRAYLRSLGIQHIFNSRTLEFGEGIKRVTPQGLGVNVVLNSLTGPGFKETSLEACAPNARFIEMSKLNVWKVDEVKTFRQDVRYSVEDLGIMDFERWRMLMEQLENQMRDGSMKGLTYTRFDYAYIRDALKYLERGRHIGKVVVAAAPASSSANTTTDETDAKIFNERSTYIITGGQRGIGLEVAKWMHTCGAKYLILCARSTQPTQECVDAIASLTKLGATVLTFSVDIGNYSEVKSLLASLRDPNLSLPPVRGIMHAAGCLSDGIIPNQNWEKYQVAMNPKVNGLLHLHELTLSYNLEHFVMFSTMGALVGAPGQSNHAGSNSFMDSFAHYRHGLGLPATSVNWGQWGDVGVAAGVVIPGFKPMSTDSALRALTTLLNSNVVQAAVCDGDIPTWKNWFPWAKNYFEKLDDNLGAGRLPRGSVIIDNLTSDKLWKELEGTTTKEERMEIVSSYIAPLLIHITKLDTNEKISKTQELQELGMDSLMLIELRNYIQKLLGPGITLSTAALMDCRTFESLVSAVVNAMYGGNAAEVEHDRQVRVQNQIQLAKEDCFLWEHIKGHEGQEVKSVSEINFPLVTGGTGSLAPYLIEILSHRESIQTVYCLIRKGKNGETAEDRLLAHFKVLKMHKRINMSKIKVVTGDITQEYLGMGKEAYEGLSNVVDGVFHSAVLSNHLARYTKEDIKYSGLRAVNVIGTQRILEFAVSCGRTRWVYLTSSLLALWKLPLDEFTLEEFQTMETLDSAPDFGYAISKFVADQLAEQAIERKIPIKVFSFPKISGDSVTGRQIVPKNHFFVKFMHYILSGMIPNLGVPLQVVPVDTCAQISLQIFFDDASAQTIYYVYNPHFRLEKEITSYIEEFGHEMRIAETMSKLMVSTANNLDTDAVVAAKWKELAKDNEEIKQLIQEYQEKGPDVWKTNPLGLLANEKVKEFIKKEYGYKGKIVEPDEFIQELEREGEESVLHQWRDFYDSDGAFFYGYNEAKKHEWFIEYDEDPYTFIEKKRNGKKTRVMIEIPNFEEIVMDPMDSLKKDLMFVMEHATEVFTPFFSH